MQTVKSFVQGVKLASNRIPGYKPIDEQINAYLKENPTHSIRTMNTILGPSYVESFVVFDIREERKNNNGAGNGQDKEKGKRNEQRA